MIRSLLLVHGAGGGPWGFDGWATDLAGVRARPESQRTRDEVRAAVADRLRG